MQRVLARGHHGRQSRRRAGERPDSCRQSRLPDTLSLVKIFGDWLDEDPTGDRNFVFISVVVISGVLGAMALVAALLDSIPIS